MKDKTIEKKIVGTTWTEVMIDLSFILSFKFVSLFILPVCIMILIDTYYFKNTIIIKQPYNS